jgi:GH24 family phage-related lysozyme (muramidase)
MSDPVTKGSTEPSGMSYLSTSLTQLRIFEGVVPWLYLDSRGNVTVGVGLMLPNLAAAQALPFCEIAPDEPATPEEIEDDFLRVSQMQPDHLPGYYRAASSVFLVDDEINQLLMARIQQSDDELRSQFASYDAFPDVVKPALIDMDYNLGESKLHREYPLLFAAVEAQDWASAALQCSRGGISPSRNAWTKQQFLLAA